jgi:predicted dehydrogenase
MVIDKAGFEELINAYATAEKKGVLLFDMMTERYSLLNKVQKSLMQDTLLFGKIQQGTPDRPAIMESSVHHYYRGGKGTRPFWFFDVSQQGEGIADVTTHLIDLTFWKTFPDEIIDYKKDIKVLSAKHWPVNITRTEFSKATSLSEIPESLNRYKKDTILEVFANGSINYQLKGINAGVKVEWRAATPKDGNDLRSAYTHGTKATLMISQTEGQKRPRLTVQKEGNISEKNFQLNLTHALSLLNTSYPGISFSAGSEYTEIVIPSDLEISRDQTFKVFIGHLENRKFPEWEVPNTIAKYYITTTALEMAKGNK